MSRFLDRRDAGRQLAAALERWRDTPGLVVAGVPRGGVPVAFEVAVALGAPLEVIVVRKIGVPGQPELAMGAVGEDGVVITESDVLTATGVTIDEFDRARDRERLELGRRVQAVRAALVPQDLHGALVMVVDDGIATGASARAACRVAHARGARAVVVAVPVIARPTVAELRDVAEDVSALEIADGPFAVGQWYRDFDQTLDEEVIDLLRRAQDRGVARTPTVDDPPVA